MEGRWGFERSCHVKRRGDGCTGKAGTAFGRHRKRRLGRPSAGSLMFSRVLVANRGEIAVRVIRALHELEIEAVAIYSTADKDSLHVRLADRAVAVGPDPASQSYRKIPSVIAPAGTTGGEAIHPGYGFLAENPAFVAACEDNSIVFVGPTADVMARMGDKVQAKAELARAEVPLVPGSEHAVELAEARELAAELGYPILLKAAAGGGGKGMRIVDGDDERAVKLIGYRNAGTFEFLLGPDHSFYFIELNARLQVEHPVTELVTGIDLVREQLRVASGERLAVTGRAQRSGHAIEIRINAEDPARDFAPAPGLVTGFRPPLGPGIRLDTFVEAGYTVPPFYDSLLGKLAVWDEDRPAAISRSLRALGELSLTGIPTTQGLAIQILRSEQFASGRYSTSFLEESGSRLSVAAE